MRRLRAHQKRDIVALEQDPPEGLARHLLDAQLLRIIEHQVHVLVKANDPPLDAEIGVLIEPNLDARFLRSREK